MPSISGVLPNLINGISQQAPALRLRSQGEEQINGYSTVSDGLIKRFPSEHLAEIMDDPDFGDYKWHFIDRDRTERYVVGAHPGGIRVWDFDGNEKTVNAPDGWSYLPETPRDELQLLTVADHTFLTNTSQVVGTGDQKSPHRNREALVFVRQGLPGRNYIIEIDGERVANVRPTTGATRSQDTSNIAHALIEGSSAPGFGGSEGAEVNLTLNGQGINEDNGWTVKRFSSVIYISKNDGTDFNINVEEGSANEGFKVFKGVVAYFSDLPTRAEEGFKIKVQGSEENDSDDYWVEFVTNKDGSSIPGIWEESIGPEQYTSFDPSTMPHTLVREEDGNFTFRQTEWDDKKIGDDDAIPWPSFVGRKINEIFLYKNRLGFLAGEEYILSKAGDLFNFWPTTAMASLDDDPIDVNSSSSDVAKLLYAVQHEGELIVFSDREQFKPGVGGNGLLSPRTVTISPTTKYSIAPECRPVVLGQTLFYAVEHGDHAGIQEMSLHDGVMNIRNTDENTSHVPRYIPAGVELLSGSDEENILSVVTYRDRSRLFIYKFFTQEQEKLQSSWSHWEFGGDILTTTVVDQALYFLMNYGGNRVSLEKVRLDVGFTDPDTDWVVRLDRRVSLSNGVYDASNDRTTYTLPYVAPSTIAAVSKQSASLNAGLQFTVESTSGTTVYLDGDTSSYDIWFGVPYEFRWRFSPIYRRQSGQNSGEVAVTNGRLQLTYLTMEVSNTVHLKAEVKQPNGQTYDYVYSHQGIPLDDMDYETDEIFFDGSHQFRIGVMGRSTDVQIDIINDSPYPSAIISAEWTGRWFKRSQLVE